MASLIPSGSESEFEGFSQEDLRSVNGRIDLLSEDDLILVSVQFLVQKLAMTSRMTSPSRRSVNGRIDLLSQDDLILVSVQFLVQKLAMTSQMTSPSRRSGVQTFEGLK